MQVKRREGLDMEEMFPMSTDAEMLRRKKTDGKPVPFKMVSMWGRYQGKIKVQ